MDREFQPHRLAVNAVDKLRVPSVKCQLTIGIAEPAIDNSVNVDDFDSTEYTSDDSINAFDNPCCADTIPVNTDTTLADPADTDIVPANSDTTPVNSDTTPSTATTATPLPKTRDKTNLTDCRPVSLLSVLSKLLEKHVHVQLNYYFENKQK